MLNRPGPHGDWSAALVEPHVHVAIGRPLVLDVLAVTYSLVCGQLAGLRGLRRGLNGRLVAENTYLRAPIQDDVAVARARAWASRLERSPAVPSAQIEPRRIISDSGQWARMPPPMMPPPMMLPPPGEGPWRMLLPKSGAPRMLPPRSGRSRTPPPASREI
jgi:hypothetical protein